MGTAVGCFTVVFFGTGVDTGFVFGVVVACTLVGCFAAVFCETGADTDFAFGVGVDFCELGVDTDFDFGVVVACTVGCCFDVVFCELGADMDFAFGVGVDFCDVTGVADTAGRVAVFDATGFEVVNPVGFGVDVALFMTDAFGVEVGFDVATYPVLLSLPLTAVLPVFDFVEPVFMVF